MKPCLRVCFPLLVVLCVPAALVAQGTVPSSSAANPKEKVVPPPTRKTNQVITDDSIALLSVRRVPPALPLPAASQKEEAAVDDEGARKAAELAALGKLIQEKQKRIAFLLRLFATDEHAFLVDPANQKSDPEAQERRAYEQDELRWETAELAKLKAKWEESSR